MVVQQPYLALFSLIVGPLAIFAIRILLTKVRSIVRKEAASMELQNERLMFHHF